MNALSSRLPIETGATQLPPWKVLIVDDEPEVHAVTHLVLGNFRFADRPLRFLDARNTAEAEALLREHADIAVMLLDVVMETDRAGLDLVRIVRERLGNQFVRIVLRTGQPGQAPEQQIIADYDINDYKEKTELTAQKLSTTMFAALRSYRDMRTIESNRRGLERVITASANIFSQRAFATVRLDRARTVDRTDRHRARRPVLQRSRVPATTCPSISASLRQLAITAISSIAMPTRSCPSISSLRCADAFLSKHHVFGDDHYVLYVSDSRASESLLYVGEDWNLNDLDHRLVEVFCTNVSIAYENLHLNRELLDSQLEMVYLLAGAAETRSYETANHVKRVGLIAELLGQLYGMDKKTTEALRLAAPLHDIGKIGIPDAILNKRGQHTPEEVGDHAHARANSAQSCCPDRSARCCKLAAEIALSHHENWDGSGYPGALAGDAIPLGGRITMLADVFDALGSQRCYKEPWPIDDIRAYIVEQKRQEIRAAPGRSDVHALGSDPGRARISAGLNSFSLPASSGSNISNNTPLPGALSTRMLPFNAWVTRLYTMCIPRPEPP